MHEELLGLQALSREDILKNVWDDAVCDEVGEDSNQKVLHRMDVIWSHLADAKLPGMDSGPFTRLAIVRKVVLSVPPFHG